MSRRLRDVAGVAVTVVLWLVIMMRSLQAGGWSAAAALLMLVLLIFVAVTHMYQAAAWIAAASVLLLLVFVLPDDINVPLLLLFLAYFVFDRAAASRIESRARMLRDAELDALFDNVFSDYEADLSRFPFRAHIFRRSGMFPVEKLQMIYSYRTHATDPDANIRFYRYFGQPGEGLVWQTCENGDVRYFRREDVPDAKSAFHLRGSQASATREVIAVLTLPLRELVGTGNSSGNTRYIGALSFDALSEEAADSLHELFSKFQEGEHPELAELADRASLYV
jgi:hypothetical protein